MIRLISLAFEPCADAPPVCDDTCVSCDSSELISALSESSSEPDELADDAEPPPPPPPPAALVEPEAVVVVEVVDVLLLVLLVLLVEDEAPLLPELASPDALVLDETLVPVALEAPFFADVAVALLSVP